MQRIQSHCTNRIGMPLDSCGCDGARVRSLWRWSLAAAVAALGLGRCLGAEGEIGAPRGDLWVEFIRGGNVMWAILALSIVGSVFLVERIWSLRKAKQIPRQLLADLREVLSRDGLEAGRALVKKNPESALARVMDALLSRNGATRRELETVLEEEGARVLFDLRRNLRPIGLTASVAPLLGLLGTVFGMIAAFRTAADVGMDDPRNFAAGIYEALYTTAFGLVVAIPFLLFYHWLKMKSEAIIRDVEDRSLSFIQGSARRMDARVVEARSVDPETIES